MLEGLLRALLPLVEPIGLIWVCSIVLTVVLVRERRLRLAALPGGLAAFVWLVGATPLPGAFLASLERPWAGVNRETLPEADAIVLLGGFSAPSREEVGGLHFDDRADRAVTALELARLGKAKTLVIGGGAVGRGERRLSEADLFQAFVTARKLAPPDVISLGACASTHDEAVRFGELASRRGWRRVLLVTSAAHMKRAAATFRTATRLEVVPAPSGFLTGVSLAAKGRLALVPKAGGFVQLEDWLHETIGFAVYRMRGFISREAAQG
jgi:uncharacterized SAM-binding protein YcdF (DUF218 family)